MRFVNVRELKSKASELLNLAAGEDIVVTRRGKPVALITGFDGSQLETISSRPPKDRINETHSTYAETPDPSTSLGLGISSRPLLNPLKAAFWDHPGLADPETLRQKIEQARRAKSRDSFRWLLTRMLERGRAVDTMKLFSLAEIREELPRLQLMGDTRRKWIRLLEVYDHA